MTKRLALLLILITVPASLPLLLSGGYEPHDLHHLADIHQMHAAMSSGQIPPRLGPDFLYGFGYPLFNFYYLLPFYTGAFFYSITGGLMVSLKMTFFLTSILSVIGMYLFLKKHFSHLASFAGATLYLYTPYRAVDLYVRGAIGEAFAIALFPWILYTTTNLIEKPKSKNNIAFTSISLALFFISHNYFFLLVAPFTAIYALYILYKTKFKSLKNLAISLSLSIALSAYWWLPAFLEYNLVSSITPFIIEDHFPFIKQLILPSWGYGSSVWGPGDEISFQIGLVNLFAAGIALLLLLKNKIKFKDNKSTLGALAFLGFLICLFLMNIRSMFIWNLIPFTNFIQFPWRFLALTTFFTAVLAAFVADKLNKKIITLAVIFGSILLTFSYFKPSQTFYKTDNEYLERLFAVKRAGPDAQNPDEKYLQYSEDYLLLPNTSEEKPNEYYPIKIIPDQNSLIKNSEALSSTKYTATLETYENSKVTTRAFDFPGWIVEVNGQKVETYPLGPYGQLTFELEPGLHEVELYWTETGLRLLADLISLSALAVILYLLFGQKLLQRAKISV